MLELGSDGQGQQATQPFHLGYAQPLVMSEASRLLTLGLDDIRRDELVPMFVELQAVLSR